MELHEVIREAIQKVVNDMPANNSLVIGIATNVTDTACDVTRDGSPTINGALLNATADALQSWVTIVPKEGSMVVAGRLEGNKQQAVILRCTEVEKIIWQVGNQTFQFDATAAVFNNGNNGGVVKVNPLLSALNAIQNSLNDLKTIIAGWTPASGDGGLALKNALITWLGQMLVPTQLTQIEDTKVKH